MTGEPTITDSSDEPTVGMLSVLALQNATLQSGMFSLFPVVEYSYAGTGSYDTSRYCMKETQAVYINALKLSDGRFAVLN
ncbi:MAG TPA: hypothetical protein VLX91_01455 [Candidatus Acidoferrales bacterium]|nr:hypothetical protein [Candidatus Acidoferrales bacterium]